MKFVMAARLKSDTEIVSDSAPLHDMVAAILRASTQIRCLRDPTRGGLSSSLEEIGAIRCENSLPGRDEVKGACQLLGLDPLYVANEGKRVAIVAEGGGCGAGSNALGVGAAIVRTVGASIGRERALVTLEQHLDPRALWVR